LSLLHAKGKSRLLASTQIHAADGEQNQTVVGRSVPVRLGTTYTGINTGTGNNNNNNTTIDNIQYRDVGLVIDVTPVITNDGYVQVKMKLESSNVEASGSDSSLTPTFTKRSLTTISRVQDGVTAIVASVKQDNQGDSRATIPVVGMLPILGRLFTTPKQSRDQSDIVITVTPHISRTPEIKPGDHLARFSGSQQSGFTQSIEEVLYRAHDEEERERRQVSQQQWLSPGAQPANQLADTGISPAPAASEKKLEENVFKLLTVSQVEGAAPKQAASGKPAPVGPIGYHTPDKSKQADSGKPANSPERTAPNKENQP
jgi:general secretion pathway protein D